MPEPSIGLLVFFLAQVAQFALFWIRLTNWRVAVGLTAWLAAAVLAASAGWLRLGPWPPPIGLVIVPGLLLTLHLAFSNTGTALIGRAGLPLLIGFQRFRILVEVFSGGAIARASCPCK